jgi:hypothetical protein
VQVNIIHSINFGNDRQLQETRRFLEKCRDTVSLSCELTDFLEAVARCKGETLAVARKQLFRAAHKIAKLFEFREQSRKMGVQFRAYVDELRMSEMALDESSPEFDFEGDLLLSYIDVLLQRWAEGNEVLADIAEQFWVYLPIEVQEYLSSDMEFQLGLRDKSSSDALVEYAPETVNAYIASVSRAENSVSRAKALNESMPQVRLTELDKRCLTDDGNWESTFNEQNPTKSTTPQSKSYTLEELLEGVTPENSHEATDWGKPVGNEVW